MRFPFNYCQHINILSFKYLNDKAKYNRTNRQIKKPQQTNKQIVEVL